MGPTVDFSVGQRFGTAVDITDAGDFLVVGAPGQEVSANPDSGLAYLHEWTGSAWEFRNIDGGEVNTEID